MKKKEKLYVQENIEEIIDNTTGELLLSKSTKIGIFEKEPSYVKLYLSDIGKLNNLNKSEQKLINELAFNMGYNNIVPNYKAIKEIIAERLGLKYNTVNEAIKGLHKKGILIKKARGVYIMDPNLFGRGSWKDIKKIRMTIEYNQDGTKSVNTKLSKQLNAFNDN